MKNDDNRGHLMLGIVLLLTVFFYTLLIAWFLT